MAVALPHWGTQIDDVFISVTYARQWLETGSLTWTSGAVVEGYSNPLWVVLSMVPIALGLDPGLFLQWCSVACTLTLLALASRSWGTSVLGVAMVVLAGILDPVSFWAVNGMETMAYAMLLAVAWAFVARREGSAWPAMLLLALAALLRPEGHLQLLAGVLAMIGLGRARIARPVAVVFGALGVYHLVRYHHFNAWLPTPLLVKGLAEHDAWQGLQQLAVDILQWGGVGLVIGSLFEGRRWRYWLALVPFSIQAVVLVNAGGDWMGHGRLVLPGAVAALAVITGEGRYGPRRPAILGLGLVLALVAVLYQSPLGSPTQLQTRSLDQAWSAWSGWGFVLDTPFIEDIQYLAPRIPSGGQVSTGDVGMVSQIPEISVVDQVGLVDRDVALHRAFGDEEALARTLARFDGSADSVLCVRVARPLGTTIEDLPGDMNAAYPHCSDVPGRYRATRYCCREPLHADATRAIPRWRRLVALYPAQPELKLGLAAALADAGGRMPEAVETLRAVRSWGASPAWVAMGVHAVDFTSGSNTLDRVPGRGFALWSNGVIESRVIDDISGARLVLRGDSAGGVGPLAVITARPSCQTLAVAVQDTAARVVELSALECSAGARGRVVVEFTNDSVVGQEDRNLYVELVDPSLESLR